MRIFVIEEVEAVRDDEVVPEQKMVSQLPTLTIIR